MNRKLLFGLLMLLFSSMSIGMFTSCKDDAEDFHKDLTLEDANLAQKIQALQEALAKVQSAQEACQSSCTAQFAVLNKQLADLDSLYNALKTAQANDSSALAAAIQKEINDRISAINAVNEEIAKLQAADSTLQAWQTKYEPIINALSTDMATVKGQIEAIQNQFGDLQGQTVEEYVNFMINSALQQFNAQMIVINEAIDGLQGQLDVVNTTLTSLQEQIDDLKNAQGPVIPDYTETINDLTSRVSALEAFKTELETWQTGINTWKTGIETWQKTVDGILAGITNQALLDAITQATWVDQNKNVLEWLIEHKDDFMKHCVCTGFDPTDLQNSINDLYTQYNDLYGKFTTLSTDLHNANLNIAANTEQINKLLNFFGLTTEDLEATDLTLYDYKALVVKVNNNATEIENLKTQIEEVFTTIQKVVDELITNLLVQNVYNTVFGSFATPLGVQSNILMTYYGWNTNNTPVSFPTNYTDVEYIAPDSEDQIFSQNVLNELNPTTYELPNGYMLGGEGNMGKLYLTINPSNVDFTQQDVELNIVNSQGEVCPVTVGDLRISDETLAFGYSRASQAPNYFYEVPVTIDAEGIAALHLAKPEISKEQVKNALQTRGIGDIAAIAKTLYNQYNNSLQAYALQTYNTIEVNGIEVPRTITSQYNFAATCVKPLSFRFLAGKEFGTDVLPTISPLSEYLDTFLKNIEFEVQAPTFNFGDFTLNITPIDDIELEYTGGLKVWFPESVIKDDMGNVVGTIEGQWIYVDQDNINELIESIRESLQTVVGSVNEDLDKIAEDIKNYINNIKTSINNTMDSFVTDINGQIQGILQDVKDELAGRFGRIDDFIERYNEFAARVNNIFHHPNHYLQVVALYKNNSGMLSQLSNSLRVPSKFQKGNGNGFMIYLTTYSAELVAPAYKKYVAITGKYDANGKAVDCSLKSLNTGELNTVLEGRQKRFAVPTSQLEAGYTYELTYQALDYHGVTSTRKMYFQIVK
ncbi:MAG: hypothetical protein J1F20_04210 [Muribaculaceae bacterium]|nr:hypothetical protein [Muribaculaceae bacterium]